MIHFSYCHSAARNEGRTNGHIAVRHGELVVCYCNAVVVGVSHIPFREEISRIGCGCQRNDIAWIGSVDIGTDGAILNLAAGHTVGCQLSKVGNVGTSRSHCEGVRRVGGNLCAVLSPVREGIASVGCRGQGAAGAGIERAAATYVTAVGRVGTGSDGVLRNGREGRRVGTSRA